MKIKTEINRNMSVMGIDSACTWLTFRTLKPVIIIIFLLSLARPYSFFATTTLSGLPAGTTELTLSNSPYIIEKDLVIDAGRNLVIQEGCNLFFKQFTGIIVHGNLTVNGSDEHPVLFSSLNDTLSPLRTAELPNPFDWNGIFISPQANCIKLSNFILKFSVYGIKSQKESIIIKNGFFKNNGQYHGTINDKVEPVSDAIPFRWGRGMRYLFTKHPAEPAARLPTSP